MKTRAIVPRLLFALLPAFFLLALPLGAGPAAQEAKPARIAILPFQTHAAKDLGYLTSGIRDMLASRLAADAAASIIDRAAVDQAMAGAGKLNRPADLTALGRQLKADYVVAGSLTAFGTGMSLDAKVLATGPDGAAQNFFATAATENDIITAVDRLAGDIASKLFGRQEALRDQARPAASPVPAPPRPAYQTAHPDRPFMAGDLGHGTASPFVRPMGVAGALGFTKSQNLRIGLRAMDAGDVDGDGETEFVLAGANRVVIYRRQQNRFVKIGEAASPDRYTIHYVSLADLNHNGRAEIYVSAADPEEPSSFALEWDGQRFAPLFQEQRWYVRAVSVPGEGMVLAGQQAGIDTFLTRGVFRLDISGDGRLSQGTAIDLPKGTNLFDFAFADLDGDRTAEIVAISQDDRLLVYSNSGKRLWVSDDYFGGTTRFLGGINYESSEAHHEHMVKDVRIYVPARIVVRDINRDGRPEVIVNKNISTASRLFEKLRSYPSGAMHALTWNGIALTELWRTRKIDGYIADFQLGPERAMPAAEKDQEPGKGAELFVGLVLGSGGLNILSGSESTVLAYPLEFSGPAAAR